MANNRIFYACQAVAIVPTGVTPGAAHIAKGVQSVGINTNFSLEQAFELGQVEIYENSEEIAEVEVTIEKLIDGRKGLYSLAVGASSAAAGVVDASAVKSDVYLAIYDDTASSVASTAAKSVVWCSGMYVSSCSWTYPVDGNATTSITLVGNDKYWNEANVASSAKKTYINDTGSGGMWVNNLATAIDGTDTPASGLQRRYAGVRVEIDPVSPAAAALSTNLPAEVVRQAPAGKITGSTKTSAVDAHLQNISVSADFGRENILELGRFGPYYKYATFPFEITSEFEVIATSGDLISVSGDAQNLTDQVITIADNAGTFLNLGTKNKLTSVSYSGGDTGGGNASITYSYSTFNDLKVVESATVDS
tara:strand:- start:904 stop:1995 length:1092 start_codon:yes stop_codon:yes gene_type:complete